MTLKMRRRGGVLLLASLALLREAFVAPEGSGMGELPWKFRTNVSVVKSYRWFHSNNLDEVSISTAIGDFCEANAILDVPPCDNFYQ